MHHSEYRRHIELLLSSFSLDWMDGQKRRYGYNPDEIARTHAHYSSLAETYRPFRSHHPTPLEQQVAKTKDAEMNRGIDQDCFNIKTIFLTA